MLESNPFQLQLDNAIPCTGDYLCGRTREEMIEAFRNNDIFPAFRDNYMFPETNLETYVDSRIALWKHHIGERMVFAIIPRSDDTQSNINLEVVRVWESEIDEFCKNHQFQRMSESIPIFS